jgi:hypothetical protein
MSTRRRDQGQAAIFLTLTLIPVLGLLGLAVDVGWASWRQEAAKNAAQAAVIAAAVAASNLSLTCGTGGVTCQGPTACPVTLNRPTDPVQAACLYAQSNGFTNGGNSGRQSVKIAADLYANTHPPVSGYVPTYWISATVSESIPATFGAVLGLGGLNPSARATAGVFSSGGGCIYTLEPTNTGMTMSGGAISSNCGVYIDSSSSSAVVMSGGTITTSGGAKTNVNGNVQSSGGTISPAWVHGPSQPDPFASLSAPSTSGTCVDSGRSFSSGTNTLSSGKHCGFISISGGTVTLGQGMHIFENGFNISGGTVSNAAGGVTLYFDGVGGLNMSGANITLTPQTTGAYKGMLIFYNRTNNAGLNMSGGGLNLTGAVYAKASTYNASGGTFTNTTFVVNQWNQSGGGTLTINGSAQTNFTGTTVSFIE